MSEISRSHRISPVALAFTLIFLVATSALATERVITIYFHGTGASLGGPQTALVDLYYQDHSTKIDWADIELAPCLAGTNGQGGPEARAQIEVIVRDTEAVPGSTYYKYSVEGFGATLEPMVACIAEFADPDTGVRTWNQVTTEAVSAIRAVIQANGDSDRYVINLVGHSRGGAMTLITARAVVNATDLVGFIDRINILAYDPVPGAFDPIGKFGNSFNLPTIVSNYAGIYCEHDRRLLFEPIVPYIEKSAPTRRWTVIIPGSHTDLVWTKPEHRAVGLAIGEQLLHSPQWGDVPVTATSSVTNETEFANAVVAMAKNYDYRSTEDDGGMTGFPWILGCHADGMIRASTPSLWRNYPRRLAFVAPNRHEPHWGVSWPWECGLVWYPADLVYWLDDVEGLHQMGSADWAMLQFMRGLTAFAAPPAVTVYTGSAPASCSVVISDAALGTATGPVTGIGRTGVPVGNLFPVGVTTVTWTATDTGGNPVTAPQYVTVVDNTPPALSVPPAVTVSTGPSASSCDVFITDAQLGIANATASDNCAGAVTIEHRGVPEGNRFPVGTTTLGYTAKDVRGNEATAQQTVTVIDDTPPVITAPPAVTVYTGPAPASCAVVINDATLGTATATDNCANLGPVERSGVPSGNSFSIGTTTLTWSVTDHAGNKAQAQQTVTVIDNTPPLLVAPPAVTAYTGPSASSCDVVISDEQLGVATATATDNCPGTVPVVHSGIPAGNRFPVGTTTLLYTATDERGNHATANQTVTVIDNTLPVITAPPSLTFKTGPQATACGIAIDDSKLGIAIAKDNCPNLGAVQRSGAPAGNFFPVGTTTLTWTVTDHAGNQATAVQTVTVIDDTLPTITAPPSLTVPTGPEANACGVVIDDGTLGVPATADNCPGLKPVERSGVPAGNFFPVGTTTITWKVTDHADNQATAVQTVTVVDATPPTIAAVSATPAVLWPANHQYVNVSVGYDAADNCSLAACTLTVISNEPVDGTGDGDTAPDWEIVDAHQIRLRAERAGTGHGRTYTITISCSDAAGKTSSASTTVTVPLNKGGK